MLITEIKMTPKIGQLLWSSCAGESYGKILAVGVDDNKTPVIAIELTTISDIAWTNDEDETFPQPDLHFVEIPPGVHVILRDIQYKLWEPCEDGRQIIECRTPGNGCYRCTKCFTLRDEPPY